MSEKKRYVLAGTGGRGLGMFAQPLLTDFAQTAELVGLFDHNKLRLRSANQLLDATLPTFVDFEQMLDELDPDGIIVCTQDSTHAEYVVAGLEAGKRVYCEKPLCTTAAQCKQIAAAASRSAGEAFVTHNMRYDHAMLALKEQIDGGKIGDLLSMEFRESLDRSHGADYFRRWHRFKEKSGGLLIHKASHHFDLMNWLVGSKATELSARGRTLFYGANGTLRGTHCRGCEHTEVCDFHIDLNSDKRAQQLYISAEAEDHYLRDGCVFDERIDTEDYAAAAYTYENGVQVNYSLCAYASYEGMFLALEGSEGRLE
jgi:predicted dehydrogenase